MRQAPTGDEGRAGTSGPRTLTPDGSGCGSRPAWAPDGRIRSSSARLSSSSGDAGRLDVLLHRLAAECCRPALFVMYKQCGMTRANTQDRVRRQVVDAILATQLDGSDAHGRASSRVRLILTGERLIATFGLDAVSLRQVAAEAGAANTSAVQYHFGSKEGLVEAIMAYRHPSLAQRRRLLLAEGVSAGAPLDLRTAVRAYVLPLLEDGEDDSSWFVGFIAQLQQFGRGRHPFEVSSPELQHPSREYFALIASFIGHVPEPLRSNRIVYAARTSMHMAADRQRSRRHDPDAVQLPYALFVADVLDTVVAGLEVTPSADARRALAGVGRTPDPRLLLF